MGHTNNSMTYFLEGVLVFYNSQVVFFVWLQTAKILFDSKIAYLPPINAFYVGLRVVRYKVLFDAFYKESKSKVNYLNKRKVCACIKVYQTHNTQYVLFFKFMLL